MCGGWARCPSARRTRRDSAARPPQVRVPRASEGPAARRLILHLLASAVWGGKATSVVDDTLLGFEVTREVRELAESLEGAYGREITFEEGASDPWGNPVRAKMAGPFRNGPSCFRISIGEGCGLYSFTHELMHAKLCANGVPVSRGCSSRFKGWWCFHVEGGLQHHVIYPWLCEMDLGVDPYDDKETNTSAKQEICCLFGEPLSYKW